MIPRRGGLRARHSQIRQARRAADALRPCLRRNENSLRPRFPSARERANERAMTTRIDARFAALARRTARRPRHFRDGGRSRPCDLAGRSCKALPEAGADVIEVGMPFTDPMADGPAIQAAGLRALKAGQTLRKTLALVARIPRRRRRDADRADGLLQSDLRLRRRALPRRRQGGGGRRAHRRRPAAGRGRGTLPAGARARGSISSGWRRRPPTTSACRPCSRTPRASSITSRSPASPARPRRTPTSSARRLRASSAIPICRSRSGSACATRPARRRSPRAPTASSSARRWSRRCAARWRGARRAGDGRGGRRSSSANSRAGVRGVAKAWTLTETSR